MAKKKGKKEDQWNLEAPFDQPASLEELLEAQPFTEAGGSDSVTAGTRIPKWMFRRVAKLTEISGSPYELASDVYRYAIYLGLRIINMRLKTARDWSVETRLAAIASDTEVMKRVRGQVDTMVSGLDNLMKEGEPEKAAENLSKYVSAAVELQDTWVRSRLFKMLRESKVVAELAGRCSPEVKKLIREIIIEEEDDSK
jgi:hypothetical protein